MNNEIENRSEPISAEQLLYLIPEREAITASKLSKLSGIEFKKLRERVALAGMKYGLAIVFKNGKFYRARTSADYEYIITHSHETTEYR